MIWHSLQFEVLLAVLGLGVLVLEAVRPISYVRCLGLGLASLVALLLFHSFEIVPAAEPILKGMYHLDAMALFLQRLFLALTAFVLVIGAEYSVRHPDGAAEFYVVTLFTAVGMLVCAAVDDFILLFVAVELVTVGFYVLVAYLRHESSSLEAGLKYLLFGGLASGVMVYGIAYVFGTTGATRFDAVAAALQAPDSMSMALGFGMLLTLVGLCFKIAAVPAQMWAPDVYQGAPTPTTAFLAVASKVAGFALLLRVLGHCFLPAQHLWAGLIAVLAGLSLLYGNLGAIGQTNLKRLMGYSSIAHAGYLLIGIAVVTTAGAAAVLFYLTQYALSGLCIFLVIVALEQAGVGAEIESLQGLHRRSPLLAAGLALPLLSLAGVPPLSGFFGKFMIFVAALQKGAWDPMLLALVLIACVGVLVSLYVYFRVIQVAYFEDRPEAQPLPVHPTVRVALILGLLLIVGLGVYPAPLWEAAKTAAAAIGLP